MFIICEREARVRGYLSQEDGSGALFFVKEVDSDQYYAWTDPGDGPIVRTYEELVAWGQVRGATHISQNDSGRMPWSGQ